MFVLIPDCFVYRQLLAEFLLLLIAGATQTLRRIWLSLHTI